MKHSDQASAGQMNLCSSTEKGSPEPAGSKPFTLAQIEVIDDRLRRGLPTSCEERQQHAHAQAVIASAVEHFQDQMTAVGHRIEAGLSKMTAEHANTVLVCQSFSNLPDVLLAELRDIATIGSQPPAWLRSRIASVTFKA